MSNVDQTIETLIAAAERDLPGDPRRAADTAGEALGMARQAHNKGQIVQCLKLMANAEQNLSDFATARIHADEALNLARQCNDRQQEAVLLHILGASHWRLGDTNDAWSCETASLELSRDIGDRTTEMHALAGLGRLLRMRGEAEQSLELHEQSRLIALDLSDRSAEAQAWLGLGNAYERLGNFQEALDCFRQSLAIATELDNPLLRAYANGNIGIIMERLGDNATALDYNLSSLEAKQQLNDRWGIGVSYNNIGILYRALGDYASALEAHMRSLLIAEEIGDREGVSFALNGIGQMYEAFGDRTRVLEYYNRSLAIAREIHYSQGQAYSLTHIGRFYETLGDLPRSLLYYFRSFRTFESIGDRYGMRSALKSIGSNYVHLGQLCLAEDYLRRGLELSREIGNHEGTVDTLLGLGALSIHKGSADEGHRQLQEALDIAIADSNRDLQRKVLWELAEAFAAADKTQQSAEYRRRYDECVRGIFDVEATRRVSKLMFDFEGDYIRREGKDLGLGEQDVQEISDALRHSGLNSILRSAASAAPLPSYRPSASPINTISSEPRIIVQTFGTFRVQVNNRELAIGDWKRKRARELFKLLLIHHRRSLTIDEIIDRLWGDTGNRNGESLVMNAASHIRRAIEPERTPHDTESVLTNREGSYILDLGEDASVDFLRFKELIVAARRASSVAQRQSFYEEATALYHGDFLVEEAFADWSAPERGLLKDAFLEAMEFLAGEHLRTGHAEQTIEITHRILMHDNTSERAHELLLLALQSLRRHGEAQRAFEECTRIFRQELDVEAPERIRRIMDRSGNAV